MSLRILGVLVILMLAATSIRAGVQEGLAAMRRGDYGTAYREFLPLANAGDVKAMITIGLLFNEGGTGLSQDYKKAFDWYLRAFDRGDGDAYNNIGVLFRDGRGVPRNRPIAYALFLIVHMRGLGSENTQIRANDNLRREVAELSSDQVASALCMSEEYIEAYVHARGDLKLILPSASSADKQRLRDKDWWLDEERKNLPGCRAASKLPTR